MKWQATIGVVILLSCAMAPLPARPSEEPGSSATGIFLNGAGEVLTARHAVQACKQLYVLKDGQASPAWVRALAGDVDAAVLGTGLKPILVAAFPVDADIGRVSTPVFAEAYSVLQAMPDRARTLFNAVTVPGKDQFSMMSPVHPGASGSAVLDAGGFVQAMVVERATRSLHRYTVRPLSRQPGDRLLPGGASEVHAMPARAIKAFLRANDVGFEEGRLARLGHGQASAPRAATLSVGVMCEK